MPVHHSSNQTRKHPVSASGSNVRAMQAALALANDVSEHSIIEMHRVLLEYSNPAIVGMFRHQQVWVKGSGAGPHGAAFIPPHHERIEGAMRDLITFANRNDVPALTLVAITHAQFETVHPFPDGNGRTGRALAQSMLRRLGVTKEVTVPISAGLLSNLGSYFDALGAYQRGDPHPIVRAFAEAAGQATANGRQLMADISEVHDQWTSVLGSLRKDAAARRVVTLVLSQPVLDARRVSKELGISAPAAYNSIESLVDLGVLTPTSANRRNRTWQADGILAALDDFADRSISTRNRAH